MKARRSNRCTSCSFLSSAPCSGGMSCLESLDAQRLGRHVLDHQQLQPVEQLGGRGLLLQARHVADVVEDVQRLAQQVALQVGEVDVHDLGHDLAIGEADVVEEAAAQEGVGQLLLVVGGDHHDRTLHGLHDLLRLVDVELHAIELEQQVVGELDVGLVDLVDQQHRPLLGGEGVPQLAALDVVADVLDPLVAQLAVAQARDGVVLVEALLRLGGRLDVPFDQRRADRLGDLMRQHGLAGAGLALDQQRPLQRDRGVDRHAQVVAGDVGIGTGKFHDAKSRFHE